MRITKERKSIFFRTPYTSLESEWNSKQGKFNKNASSYLQKNKLLLKFLVRATDVITSIEQEKVCYNLYDVEKALRIETNPTIQNVFSFGQEIILELEMAGRTGNARIHKQTLESIKKLHKNKELKFQQITSEFLEKYEAWLRSKGGTDGGIGVRMRCIRGIFNSAINRGRIKENIYPFKIYKILKLKGKGIKKALTLEDVHKITELDLSNHPTLIDTRNYFVFSFYTRGMNFADMMTLRWSDISEDRIYYTHSKTKKNFQMEKE